MTSLTRSWSNDKKKTEGTFEVGSNTAKRLLKQIIEYYMNLRIIEEGVIENPEGGFSLRVVAFVVHLYALEGFSLIGAGCPDWYA